MGQSPILSTTHTVTIATMLSFNDGNYGNNGHRLKVLRVNTPLNIQRNLSFTVTILENLLC